MAASGRMQGNSLTIGGQGNQYYFIDWQIASQSTTNNTSTINWQNYFHYQLADAQLDNGDATLGGALRWQNTGRVKNYAGTFTTRDHAITSGSFTVTHDANGNFTIGVSGGIDVYQTGRSSGSASWALTQITRITSLTYTNITDVGFTINVTTSGTCDRLEFSTNNGSTYTADIGDFTTKSFTVTGLASQTTFQVVTRVRNKADAQYVTSSATNVTTNRQSYFLGLQM